MTGTPPHPPFAAIVVAAGQGLRAGQGVPKQFAAYRGKPLVRHSVETLLDAGADPMLVVIPPGAQEAASEALRDLTGVSVVEGGATRQQSVRNALEHLAAFGCEYVLVHDAARPTLPRAVIERVVSALGRSDGAIPVLPLIDSLVQSDDDTMKDKADRTRFRRVQTPQGFRFPAILAAHRAWTGEPDASDDAQVLHAAGGRVALVEGDEALRKVTFAQDFKMMVPPVRTGIGFDVHQLAEGEELRLNGVRIDHPRGLNGHSDADVGLHAIVDALLGAIGAGDIGTHFPPSDPQWKGARSSAFVERARDLVAAAGYAIGNIDVTLICEAPKIGPHREAMRAKIAQLLSVDISQVSVKATTSERLGFTGRGEGIAAQAVATLIKQA